MGLYADEIDEIYTFKKITLAATWQMVGREGQEWRRGEELRNNYYDQEMKVAWIRETKDSCSMNFRGST